jgi:hypothetical protein
MQRSRLVDGRCSRCGPFGPVHSVPCGICSRHTHNEGYRFRDCVWHRDPNPGSFFSTPSDLKAAPFSGRTSPRGPSRWQDAVSSASACGIAILPGPPGWYTISKISSSPSRSWLLPVGSAHFFFTRSLPVRGSFKSINTSFNAIL